MLARLVEQYWAFESIENFDQPRIEGLLQHALAGTHEAACWVAENDGKLEGYLFAVFVLSLEHGGLMAEIDEFFVISAARGRGVGLALLRYAEEALKKRGIFRLQLQLAVANQSARDFYIGSGYERRVTYELWDKHLDQ